MRVGRPLLPLLRLHVLLLRKVGGLGKPLRGLPARPGELLWMLHGGVWGGLLQRVHLCGGVESLVRVGLPLLCLHVLLLLLHRVLVGVGQRLPPGGVLGVCGPLFPLLSLHVLRRVSLPLRPLRLLELSLHAALPRVRLERLLSRVVSLRHEPRVLCLVPLHATLPRVWLEGLLA